MYAPLRRFEPHAVGMDRFLFLPYSGTSARMLASSCTAITTTGLARSTFAQGQVAATALRACSNRQATARISRSPTFAITVKWAEVTSLQAGSPARTCPAAESRNRQARTGAMRGIFSSLTKRARLPRSGEVIRGAGCAKAISNCRTNRGGKTHTAAFGRVIVGCATVLVGSRDQSGSNALRARSGAFLVRPHGAGFALGGVSLL